MTATSFRRIVVPLIALIAAGGITLLFGNQLFRGASRSDASRGTIAPNLSTPTSERHAEELTTPTVPRTDPAVARTGAEPIKTRDTQHEPTFDIVRIEPNGEAVIAGRASPKSIVELLRDGEVHSRAVADQSGEFVIVPLQLPAGAYKLTLRSKQPDGSELTSKQTVPVALEPTPNRLSIAATKIPEVVPQQPAQAKTKVQDRVLVFEAIVVDPDGKFHVRGRAPSGAAIKLYLNDNFVASVTSGSDEHFAITINEGISAGAYRVRLEEVEPKSGAILARTETRFNVPATSIAAAAPVETKKMQRDTTPIEGRTDRAVAAPVLPKQGGSPSDVVIPEVVTASVTRGDSLWRISRHTYGLGERYPLIFGANRKQIHNPNLIYPGQILVLPRR